MKINELVKEVNSYFLNLKAIKRDDGILIISSNDEALLLVPEKATNFMEVHFYVDNQGMYFTKANREKLSALIDEFLKTPIEDRTIEKRYRLVAKRKIDQMPKYVKKIITGFDEFIIDFTNLKSEAMQYNDSDLKVLAEREPLLAPAIDAMKEPVEDN